MKKWQLVEPMSGIEAIMRFSISLMENVGGAAVFSIFTMNGMDDLKVFKFTMN